jgi:hypothetical protein
MNLSSHLGPADSLLTGVAVFERNVRAREPGGSHWREELKREVALWSERQLEELQTLLSRRRSPTLFDADEAAEAVGDKTSVQCARLVFLLERVKGRHEWEPEDEAEVDDNVMEEEGEEDAAAVGGSGEDKAENADLYLRGVLRHLASIIALCAQRRRSGRVREEDVHEAVRRVKKRAECIKQ